MAHEELSLQENRKTTDLNRKHSHHCWFILKGKKKNIAGLVWMRCKSENLIQYCPCQQVHSLQTELGKTQREDTYKLQKTV